MGRNLSFGPGCMILVWAGAFALTIAGWVAVIAGAVLVLRWMGVDI